MQITRVNRSKSAARKAYDRLSRIYDILAGSSEARFTRLGMEMLSVSKGETVLEIGSGTGKALLELSLHAGETGSVHGLDLSPNMLRCAHDRLERMGMLRQTFLLEGDGASLPYKSGSFSAIFISFTLELFDTPEIPIVLAECQRVLKPAGRIGVVSLMKREPVGKIIRLYEWFHEHLPTYVDCRPIDASVMIQEAGFVLEKCELRSMWGLPVAVVMAKKS